MKVKTKMSKSYFGIFTYESREDGDVCAVFKNVIYEGAFYEVANYYDNSMIDFYVNEDDDEPDRTIESQNKMSKSYFGIFTYESREDGDVFKNVMFEGAFYRVAKYYDNSTINFYINEDGEPDVKIKLNFSYEQIHE
jgi:hypothetical protein